MIHTTRLIVISAVICVSANATDWTRIRRISQVTACLVSGLDAAATAAAGANGGVELNPITGSGRPQMGRIIGVKAGVCAGSIIFAEYRHHKEKAHKALDQRHERATTFVSAGLAGMFTALAAHAFHIARTQSPH